MSTQSQVNPDIASVEQHTNKAALMGGKVSTQVLQDFSDGCKPYIFHKEIAADKQVTSIIMGIKDQHIKDWYHVNKATVNTLTFNTFMLEFHT